MIVSSIFLYFFCRLPELVGKVIFYTRTLFVNANECSTAIFCYLLLNTIEYLYMISYIFNIFLYYKFNSNFKVGLRDYLGLSNKKT